MVQDRTTDNPYQSPRSDDAARKPGIAFRRTWAGDLAIVGGVRGSLAGAAVGGGVCALLRGSAILWTRLAESGELGGFAEIEAVLAETVGSAAFGAILGAFSGLLIGTTLGIVAGRSDTCFRGRLVVLSAMMFAASGLGWSALLGLTTFEEFHTWHPPLPILTAFIAILTAAMGGVWLAVKIADAAWRRGESDDRV